jgi:hypothetical protein
MVWVRPAEDCHRVEDWDQRNEQLAQRSHDRMALIGFGGIGLSLFTVAIAGSLVCKTVSHQDGGSRPIAIYGAPAAGVSPPGSGE